MPEGFLKPHQRVGFFGGSFDPPHLGHLSIAQKAIDYAALDLLLICPAYHAPLRQNSPLFAAKHRWGMIEAVCRKLPKACAFDYETRQQKTCYTFDTICEVKKLFRPQSLFLIIGADQFLQLPKWRNIDQLKNMVEFLVFSRESETLPPNPIPDLHWSQVTHPLHPASSSAIREKIKQNHTISQDLPEEVLQYLKDFSLLSPV